jgi:hypothetical protein
MGSLTLFLVFYEEIQISSQIKKKLNSPLLNRARGTSKSIRKIKKRKRLNKKSKKNRPRKRRRPSKRKKDWKSKKHSLKKRLLILHKVSSPRSRENKPYKTLKPLPRKNKKVKMTTSLPQKEMAVEQINIFGRRL